MPTPRRTFLKASAAATLGTLALPSIAAGQSDKKIRIAVVGGGFGRLFYWHLHPHAVVTAVTDLCEDRRKALAMTAPGIVAHESSRRGGVQLAVPQFDR